MRTFGRVLVATTIALLVAGAAVAFAASGPSGRFKAGGHRLYLTCVGTGKPVVVLESGLGADSSMWDIASYARVLHTRVCAYDRYGLGQSDGKRAPATRTIARTAADLRALLRSARLKGPYVLSAHSIGGLIVREYARRYPKDVAGMVLFDTAPDDWDIYTGIQKFEEGTVSLNVVAASAALRQRDTIQAKPLVVVKAAINSAVASWASGKTDFNYYWDSRQRALAKISTNSIFVVARGVGHEIPQEAPRLSNEAMRLVVDAARTHKKLPACGKTKLPKLGGSCNAPPVPKP